MLSIWNQPGAISAKDAHTVSATTIALPISFAVGVLGVGIDGLLHAIQSSNMWHATHEASIILDAVE